MDWLNNPGRRIGRLLLIGMVVYAALGSEAPTHAHAARLGSGPTLDLATDRNKDGIPDELAAAFDAIATAQDKDAAIKDLVSRLPYSDETRALQEEAGRLQAKLTEESSEAEVKQINAELLALNQKMADDPNYVLATDALRTLATPNQLKAGPSLQSVNWGLLAPGDILLHGG